MHESTLRCKSTCSWSVQVHVHTGDAKAKFSYVVILVALLESFSYVAILVALLEREFKKQSWLHVCVKSLAITYCIAGYNVRNVCMIKCMYIICLFLL